jgi:hypothetical protein
MDAAVPGAGSGSRIVKVVPSALASVQARVPPNSPATMSRAIERPSPVPRPGGLVV